MIRLVSYLAAIYGLMGAVCFAFTPTAFAFFVQPAIWITAAAAIVLVIALVGAGLSFLVIALGKAAIDRNASLAHPSR